MAITSHQLRSIFENEYRRDTWRNALQDIFHINNLHAVPQHIEVGANPFDAEAFELGYFETSEGYQVGVYEVSIANKQIANNKAGLRNLMRKVYKTDNDAALIVFTQGTTWRFTYASELTITNKETGKRESKQTDTKRYTYLFGRNQHCRTAVDRFTLLSEKNGLYSDISIQEIDKAFSVDILTKQFYKELFDWYQWALSDDDGFAVTFPNNINTESDDRMIEEHIIRLITRLMFVWFIKQKNLIPEKIFDIDSLRNLLKDFDPLSKTQGNYYNAILQNLFFATLNKAIPERTFAGDGSYNDRKGHYGIKSLFRNPKGGSWFNIPNNEVIELFSKVPFLNGGLFECLDKEPDGEKRVNYWDGFSREAGRQRRAFIPNCLFFDENRGLIQLLEKYNFTVEESTPNDVEVALDPELLGKVFENLLGAYNPETKTTARKQSGSFYTPREIVNYMVDESLIAYLNSKCSEVGEDKIRTLFAPENGKWQHGENHRVNLIQAVKSAKILDPACGSGAYPMGVLNRMVDLLQKLEEKEDPTPYDQKLHLIQNCIYGIDIQSIAVQISKLRFFISLICEQIPNSNPDDNYGIIPLPNLETKFVAANTLIGLEQEFTNRLDLGFTGIRELKDKLWEVRRRHFSAKDAAEKHKLRQQDERLRLEIQEMLVNLTGKPDENKIKQWQDEIAGLEKENEQFKGENWVNLEPAAQQMALFDLTVKNEQQSLDLKYDKNKEERSRIAKLIKEKQKKIESENSKSLHLGFEKDAAELAKWNPYDQNTSSKFFDAEWMFDVGEGFDVVIGNPPYIGQKGNNEIFKPVKESALGKMFHQRRMDYFYFFFHQALNLSVTKGIINFITTNYYITATYADLLRKDFKDRASIRQLINFNEFKIFESAAGQHNLITLLTKDKDNHPVKVISTHKSGFASSTILCNILSGLDENTSYFEMPDQDIYEGNLNYIRLQNDTSSGSGIDRILELVKNAGKPLGEICYITQGIVTGADKLSKSHIEKFGVRGNVGDGIFAVSTDEVEDLGLNQSEELFLKPWFKNSDIGKWITNESSNESLIYYTSKTEKKIGASLLNHFEKYKPILINRNTRSGTPIITSSVYDKYVKGSYDISYVMVASAFKRGAYYCVSYARDAEYFESPKIVAPQRSSQNTFGYNETSWYASADVYFIIQKDTKVNLKYVLALLNSKLYYNWFYHKGKRKGQSLELYLIPLSETMIKIADTKTQNKFVTIAEKIISQKKAHKDTTTIEQQIDNMVYKLYELTYEEVKIIDPEFWLSEEEYDNLKLED